MIKPRGMERKYGQTNHISKNYKKDSHLGYTVNRKVSKLRQFILKNESSFFIALSIHKL